MMGAALAVLLRRRVDRLAAAAVARLGRQVAQRWERHGVVTHSDDTVRLLGPGVRRRRRGERDALADADLLWPGGEA